jgi:hypothetical protein
MEDIGIADGPQSHQPDFRNGIALRRLIRVEGGPTSRELSA